MCKYQISRDTSVTFDGRGNATIRYNGSGAFLYSSTDVVSETTGLAMLTGVAPAKQWQGFGPWPYLKK